MMDNYDSTPETRLHIRSVWELLQHFTGLLAKRALDHDFSKLVPPEKAIYDEFTPKLKDLTYGSDEYKQCLEAMGAALQHHYEHNRHHPEHFENGVNDMTLLDIIEMLADWKAASLRHEDGDILESIEINRERFGLSDQLARILINTVKYLAWNEQ